MMSHAYGVEILIVPACAAVRRGVQNCTDTRQRLSHAIATWLCAAGSDVQRREKVLR
jgi:hypothetical protein